MNDITWVFHAGDGRGRVLRFLVERYTHDLEPLLPRVESDDPWGGSSRRPFMMLVRPRSSGATLLRARRRTG